MIDAAYHNFDADGIKRYYLRGATGTKAECPVDIDIDIDKLCAHDRTTGARLQEEAYGAVLKNCGAVGATVTGSTRA